jgi:hypothetical protein
MNDAVATSIAESLIMQSGSSDSSNAPVSVASSDGSSDAGASDGSGGSGQSDGVETVDPNLRVDLVGHHLHPYLADTTYTRTTTKGGVEDIYSSTLMVPIKMSSAEAIQNQIWSRADDHPERLYYEYRFRYELAILLGVTSENFKIASITEAVIGSGDQATTEGVIVNTVFTSTGTAETQRTPEELLIMLRALQADMSSSLHASEFFKYIFRDFALNAIFVSRCPDADFRAICPYMESIMASDISYIVCIASIEGIALLLALFLFGAWRCDHDGAEAKQDKVFFQKAGKGEPKYLDPGLQNEYAKSWLEGRYMGDDL